MKRMRFGWIGSAILMGAVLSAMPAQAEGVKDFTLTRAVPADAMMAVFTRNHEGMSFVREQTERVWAAIEKQHFERDIKRMMQGMIRQSGGETKEFDAQWRKINDLASLVRWSQLGEREFAFAMTLGLPTGADYVMLMMPPKENVDSDFEGLTSVIQGAMSLAPEGQFTLTTDGEGKEVTHRITLAGSMPPMMFTLARHQDVIVFGFGTSMVEQSLALLRGETTSPDAVLVSSPRFQQAMKRLPAPRDSISFIDVGKMMSQSKIFANMIAPTAAPATGPDGEAAKAPFGFVGPLVDELDLWEYIASVQSTDGLQMNQHQVTVYREAARQRALYKALYGGKPLRDALKYIPKEATSVSVGSGIDFQTLYRGVIDFVKEHVPNSTQMLAEFEAAQTEMKFDIEKDLLSWLGGNSASFTAPIPTPFMPGWVYMVEVSDPAQAEATLEKLATRLDAVLVEQQGGVIDAELEEAPGFKRIILPPMLAMMPGLGAPHIGVIEGRLFVANSKDILLAALDTGKGERENFSKSERYQKEGLELADQMTGFSFSDLSKWGEELGTAMTAAGVVVQMSAPQAMRDPVVSALLTMMTKAGNVARELNYFSSSCSVTTRDGRASIQHKLTNYKEPPSAKKSAAKADSQ